MRRGPLPSQLRSRNEIPLPRREAPHSECLTVIALAEALSRCPYCHPPLLPLPSYCLSQCSVTLLPMSSLRSVRFSHTIHPLFNNAVGPTMPPNQLTMTVGQYAQTGQYRLCLQCPISFPSSPRIVPPRPMHLLRILKMYSQRSHSTLSHPPVRAFSASSEPSLTRLNSAVLTHTQAPANCARMTTA